MYDREIRDAPDDLLVELFSKLARHPTRPRSLQLAYRIGRELRHREMHRHWTGMAGPIDSTSSGLTAGSG